MAAENTVGIGITATSQLKEVFEGNIAATKELTAAIQSLSEFLKTHATALSAVETAQKNITTSTKEITEAKKAEQTVLRDEAVTWDDLIAAANEEAGAQRQATQATKERAKADEDALVVRKALSKASADDRGWMGMTPKQNPDTENAAWLRYFETILKGTGDATVALQQLKRAQDEMSSPKAERDIFIGQQLDQLLQLNAAQVNADQVRRVLTGTTVEQIKAEEGLVQVNQPLVNALSQQAKLSGDLATARAVLNETLQTGIVTDTQRVQIQNAILKIDQDLAKAEQEKVSQELQLAELEAKRLVAQNNLGGALTRLTEAQNNLNLSESEQLKLALQIDQLKARQQAQADQENEAEIRLLQTKARGEVAAKNYAEAINLLQQAQAKAIPGTQEHAQVTNQLADAQRKAEAAASGASEGIHSMWSQSFIFFGIAMGVNSAIQEIASTTGEKANPQLQTFSRILQEVSSGAMVGMMSGGGALGMGIGALSGLALGTVIALGQLDKATIELNQSLETLAKKNNAAETLARMAGVSTDAAEKALELAKNNQNAADSLQASVKANESAIPVVQGLGDAIGVGTNMLAAFANQARQTVPGIGGLTDAMGRLSEAFNENWVRGVAFAKVLAETGNVAEAQRKAAEAATEYANRQQNLTEKVQLFAGVQGVTTDAMKATDAAFKRFAQQDEVEQTLSAITGLSEETVAAAVKSGTAHQELAQNVSEALTAYQNSAQELAALKATHKDTSAAAEDLQAKTDALTQALRLLAAAAEDAYGPVSQLFAAAAKKDLGIQQLMDLAGVTREDADAAVKGAQAHGELAVRIQQDVDAMREYQRLLAQGATPTELRAIQFKATQFPTDVTAAANAYYADEAQKINDRLVKDAASAQEQIMRLERDAGLERERLARELAERKAEIAFRANQAEEKYAYEQYTLARDLSEKLSDLNYTAGQDAEKYQYDLFKIQRDYNDKTLDAQRDLDDKIVDHQRDAAYRRYTIERGLRQDLAALDWQTTQAIESSKTENERRQLEERAVFEAGQLRERADNALEDNAHQLSEQTSAARRAHQEQLEDAKRRIEEEMADRAFAFRQEEEGIQHQRDVAIRANRDRMADLAFGHRQEEANILHELAVAEIANQNRLYDLRVRLINEINDVHTRYELERQEIVATANQAVISYSQMLALQNALTSGLSGGAGVSEGTPTSRTTRLRAGGGDVLGGVTYLVGEEGPELLRLPVGMSGTVIPNSQISNSYGGHTFNIYESKNPRATAQEIQRILDQEAWR